MTKEKSMINKKVFKIVLNFYCKFLTKKIEPNPIINHKK